MGGSDPQTPATTDILDLAKALVASGTQSLFPASSKLLGSKDGP